MYEKKVSFIGNSVADLQSFSEIIGVLSRIEVFDDFCIASFIFQNEKSVKLPIELVEKLSGCIGSNVAVFRVGQDNYRVREISQENEIVMDLPLGCSCDW